MALIGVRRALIRPKRLVISGGGASLSLDGTPQTANTGGATTIVLGTGLTTSNANDVIVVAVVSNAVAPGVSSVTSANLTFARQPGLTPPQSGGSNVDVWSAIAGSALSNEIITVTQFSSAFGTMLAFAVSGANTSSPWDASTPTTVNSGAYATLTTASANTFGIGVAVNNVSSPSSGWTVMDATALSNFLLVEYKIFSATQSGTVWDSGSGASIATALKA